MVDLPGGTVTFLMTDVEGSTAAWELDASAMGDAVAALDRIVGTTVDRNDGVLVKPRGEGDSHFCVFDRAVDAVVAALELQRALQDQPLRVRMAVHTGEPDERDGDYYGPAVNRAARLRAIAHGGQVLLSAATARLVADALPDGTSLLDLGEHRLKDLARAEEVSQLCHPDLPADFPPLRSLEAVRHNLPIQPSALIGRAEEVAALGALLTSQRLVTVVGLGGAGKTRLALQVAADAATSFPGGVWLVELGGVRDAAGVGAQLRASVPGARPDEADDIASVITALAGEAALVVLDNCEHMIDACADVVGALLRRLPAVSIIATSRQPLRVAGEVTYQLAPLALPDRDHLPKVEALSAYAAVELFISRAREVRSDFEVTTDNAPSVAGICGRLDGIPLAIELAAARMRLLTAEELFARIDDRFAVLTGGARTAMPHQQTLRAALDWSHDLLSDGERAVLRRLSAVRGRVVLEVVEAIGAGGMVRHGDVLDHLSALVDHSLVVTEQMGAVTVYRCLETVREYAAEKLHEVGEADGVAARHARALITWATAYEATAATERSETRTAAEAMADDLGAALAWVEGAEDEEMTAAVVAVAAVWNEQGRARDAGAWIERALTRDGGLAATRRAELLVLRAHVAGMSWRNEDALADTEAAIELLGGGPSRTSTLMHFQAADAAIELDRWDLAEQHLDAARADAQAVDDAALAFRSVVQRALIAHRRRDWAQAAERFEAAIVAASAFPAERHSALRLLGLTHAFAGDHQAAVARLRESLEDARQRGDRSAEAQSLVSLSRATTLAKDAATTVEHAGAAVRVSTQAGEHELLRSALVNLTGGMIGLGDEAGALESLDRLRHLDQRRADVADTAYWITEAAFRWGPTSVEAVQSASAVMAALRPSITEDVPVALRGRTAQVSGVLARQAGNAEEAVTHLEAARPLLRAATETASWRAVELNLALAKAALEDWDGAATAIGRADALDEELGGAGFKAPGGLVDRCRDALGDGYDAAVAQGRAEIV